MMDMMMSPYITVRNKNSIDKPAIRKYVLDMNWFGIDEFTVTGRWHLTRQTYSASLIVLLFGDRQGGDISSCLPFHPVFSCMRGYLVCMI